MPGGLLNLVAYGNQNIMLTGNPSKTFFKCTYAKYTNFGLQKFRIDFDGQRSLRMTQPSTLRFKVPRYGDLLMDTYLVMTLPTIWSTLLPPRQCPTVSDYNYGNKENKHTNMGSTGQRLIDQDYKSVWSPYEFKWIKNLGTQMIKEVRFLIGGQVIQKFTGDYLYALVERDFNNSKKDLYYKMTGNVPEINDPANAFGRTDTYPNAWPTNTPNYKSSGPEPSIRSRKLYVPLNIWFTMASKMAFPLVSLQYNELHIEIVIRPVQELFVIRDVESVGKRISPSAGVPQGNYIQPNFNNSLHQFYRFLQPPPVDNNGSEYESISDIWRNDYYIDQRTNWAADIHLMSTYAFLSDDEVKVFALKPQNYLVKEVYHSIHKNVVGTQKITLETTGMVSNWMWYLQRTDAPLRNEWSNYTNWPYDKLPNNVIDPLDFPDVADNSTPEISGEQYNAVNVSFVDPMPDEHQGLRTTFEGIYRVEAGGLTAGRTVYNNDNGLQLHATLLASGEGWAFFNTLNGEAVSLNPTLTGGFQSMGLETGESYRLEIGKIGALAYVPPKPIGRGIDLKSCLCDDDISTCPSFRDNDAPITMIRGELTPAYNPWTDNTITGIGSIRYNCKNGTCVEDVNGVYSSLAHCQAAAACSGGPKLYDCNSVSGECVEKVDGPYGSIDQCHTESACSGGPKLYSCDSAGGACASDASGSYSSLVQCRAAAACSGGAATKFYSCNTTSGKCEEDPGGSYSSIAQCQQEAACSIPAPKRYSCNSSSGECVEDPTGSYSSIEQCQQAAACSGGGGQFYSCNNYTGECTIDDNGEYNSLSVCKAACETCAQKYPCTACTDLGICMPCNGTVVGCTEAICRKCTLDPDKSGTNTPWVLDATPEDPCQADQWGNPHIWTSPGLNPSDNPPGGTVPSCSNNFNSNLNENINDSAPAPVPIPVEIHPNLPYYKTNFKITGDFKTGNQKDIMLTWALVMDGKYRENDLDAGVLNYVEKYVRTSGNAPDGLYCYNFGLHSSPFDFQPSGAINLSKFRTVEFEVSTYAPPSDPNAETLTICDSDGNIVGINKPVWRVYDYTYDLVVMEERYNVLKFISGNAALAYAR